VHEITAGENAEQPVLLSVTGTRLMPFSRISLPACAAGVF
jgi:hypothetical protein